MVVGERPGPKIVHDYIVVEHDHYLLTVEGRSDPAIDTVRVTMFKPGSPLVVADIPLAKVVGALFPLAAEHEV